jgi:hypothetical protein
MQGGQDREVKCSKIGRWVNPLGSCASAGAAMAIIPKIMHIAKKLETFIIGLCFVFIKALFNNR